MRKLKLQVQISIDGFIGGENGELDWMIWNWDEGLKGYLTDLTEGVSTIVLGRKMAAGFIAHWAAVAADPGNEEYEAGKKFTETEKWVFSKTIDHIEGENSHLAKGDLVEEINRLKASPGGDIIAYGGAGFVSSLIAEDLIDEYHLFVNPVAIGKGLSIFGEAVSPKQLSLKDAIPFECGIVLHHYERKA